MAEEIEIQASRHTEMVRLTCSGEESCDEGPRETPRGKPDPRIEAGVPLNPSGEPWLGMVFRVIL